MHFNRRPLPVTHVIPHGVISMASALVRSALYTVQHSKSYLESSRMKKIKTQIDYLLSEIVMDDAFDEFAIKLHQLVENLILSCMPIHSASARQELWVKYHKLRSFELDVL